MELVVRTTAVLALAFVASAALRRATPATRHLLWHVTILIVVLAPALHVLTPRIVLPVRLSSFDAASREIARPGTAEAVLSGTADEAPRVTNGGHHVLVGGHRLGGARIAARVSPSTLWIAGSLLAGAWFAFGWLASFVIARRATPAPGVLAHEARLVARDLRVTRVPQVRLMASTRGPMTTGILRPIVLLPASATDWDTERRRAILAHELAHVRRADTRTQALAHLACALYWFNPLIWMATRALRRERERACDDAVVMLGISPSAYARDLLDIARVMSRCFAPSAAIAMARHSELEGRLLSLLASERRRTPVRISRWALSTAMTAVAVLALGGEPGAAEAVVASATTREQPPAPSLLYENERQAHARERERNHDSADTLRHSDDEDAREWAALSLAFSGDAAAIPALTDALDDPSSQVREKAAMGLAMRSSPEVVEPLIRALADADARVREKAAAGLMLRRDPRVLDALLVAIIDADAQVREKAALALGTLGDTRATGALERASRDRHRQVREKAVAALALLGVVQ